MATILIAEDEEQYSVPIRNCCERYGYKVIVVTDVDGLKRQIAGASVIIIDAFIPEKNEDNTLPDRPYGIMALVDLINKRRLSDNVPVIVISSYLLDLQQELEKHNLDRSRFVCIDKPIVCDALAAIIKQKLTTQ